MAGRAWHGMSRPGEVGGVRFVLVGQVWRVVVGVDRRGWSWLVQVGYGRQGRVRCVAAWQVWLVVSSWVVVWLGQAGPGKVWQAR